jgi:ATP/maltotriose-dependent transcriptional regulator MalT
MPRDTDPWAELDGGSPPAPRGEVPRAPFVDWCELLLCEVHLRTGRTAEATDRLVTLVEPHRDEAIRFAALRAQAVVAALGGRYERAHHLLNSAGGVAARIPSRHRGALVERDRALVLAGEGRVHEALAIAERVATPLIRPVAGPHQRWSRLEAASMALALARTVTRTGDELSGRRLLAMGEAALAGVHAPFLDAHRALARAVVLGPDGEPGEIEDLLTRATTTFEHAGDRPAAALVAREHGRLAHVRGLERSARPFYVQAAAELRSYGWTVDAAEADRLRAALDAGHPPPFRYGNVP